jgi:CRISPR-associated protein Csm5
MTRYRFRAQALTPVHIGSGHEIDPLEFMLQRNRLIHFNPAEIVNRLAPDERHRFLQLLEKAELKAVQSFLRTHLDPQQPGLVHVDISEEFRREFEEKASNPNNQFRVDMMPRNPHLGTVYLPGSSIKGAIRTALVNYFANLDPTTRESVHQAVRGERNDNNKSRLLEEKALNRRHSETERDVLRLLEVEDVSLPDASTRIDRAVNLNPTKSGSQKIQIWVERLKSLADETQAPAFAVTLHLDTKAMKDHRVRACLGRTIDFETILQACNRFYWGRMTAEADKFDGRSAGGENWKSLHGLFPKGKTTDGEDVIIDPSKPPWWCSQQKKRILLRVGRFSHFESLSVDELRKGYNVQARRPIEGMGASRTRCAMGGGKSAMPFGWVQLTLESAP